MHQQVISTVSTPTQSFSRASSLPLSHPLHSHILTPSPFTCSHPLSPPLTLPLPFSPSPSPPLTPSPTPFTCSHQCHPSITLYSAILYHVAFTYMILTFQTPPDRAADQYRPIDQLILIVIDKLMISLVTLNTPLPPNCPTRSRRFTLGSNSL